MGIESIGIRLKAAREKANLSQNELSDQLEIAVRTYRNYEKDTTGNINIGLLNKAAHILDVDPLWLYGAKEKEDVPNLDSIFLPYLEVLKNVCLESESEDIETETLEEMIKLINTKIAKYLVSSLLKEVKDLPLFEKAKNLIIINDLGATVRIWSIIEQAALNNSNVTAKEKLITAAKKGFSLNKFLISQGERDFIAKFVETWPDESCVFLLEHSNTFIEALKQLSPKANKTISTNTKILEFVRR